MNDLQFLNELLETTIKNQARYKDSKCPFEQQTYKSMEKDINRISSIIVKVNMYENNNLKSA